MSRVGPFALFPVSCVLLTIFNWMVSHLPGSSSVVDGCRLLSNIPLVQINVVTLPNTRFQHLTASRLASTPSIRWELALCVGVGCTWVPSYLSVTERTECPLLFESSCHLCQTPADRKCAHCFPWTLSSPPLPSLLFSPFPSIL